MPKARVLSDDLIADLEADFETLYIFQTFHSQFSISAIANRFDLAQNTVYARYDRWKAQNAGAKNLTLEDVPGFGK